MQSLGCLVAPADVRIQLHPRRENFLCSIDFFRDKYYAELDKLPTVRRLPPHCCRHTYVTNLQRKGVPMETIAALVGHSDIETTDD